MTPSGTRIYNKLKDQKGATIVEFSIIALLFFTLFFGIIDFGLLLFNQQVITNAGREGARCGVVARPEDYKVNTVSIIDKVKEYAENHIVSFGDKKFTVEVSFESGLTFCEKFRDELTVDVTYEYSFLFLPFAPKTLGTKAIMICE
jgi:Flp pilus assembly protein TadG